MKLLWTGLVGVGAVLLLLGAGRMEAKSPAAPAAPLPPIQHPPRIVSGTTDVLLLTDCGNYVHYESNNPVTVTVQTRPWGPFCDIALVQDGQGQVSPISGPGMGHNRSPYGWTKTVGPNAMIVVHLVNFAGAGWEYYIWGDGAK